MNSWAVIVIIEERAMDFVAHVASLHEVFGALTGGYELVLVANGVGEFVREQLDVDLAGIPPLKLIEFAQRTTFAACLGAALDRTRGAKLLICGSYQKITPASMLQFVEALDDETDMVVPWRQNRVDPDANQFQSRLFNSLVRRLTKTPFHDLNCNVRVVRRVVLEELELYGDMYRFLPILALERGFRVRELSCDHYAEHGKTGFFGFREYAARLVDIAVLFFRTGHARKPLRFFGAKGVLSAGLGFLILIAVATGKAAGQYPIGNNPWTIIGLILILLGVQLAGIGLVGEILAFTYGRQKKDYVIETEL